ncbi:hypothetical protein FJ490_02125 [Mesorhizobium sp. B2-5-11]|nr:hypothetical protein FJ490_02125 [Mesorhizobium sp. B2-5-11]
MKAAAESLGQGAFGVILADPPWRFEPYSRQTGMDRAADNHYPTMDVDAIAKLEVPAAADCALFLWATSPMIREALFVMSAWGFEYKSQLIWLKDRIGTGYWARNKHEILLIGTRGDIPAPSPGTQPESVVAAAVGAHSEKPAAFHEIIERIYPNLPRLEMFARASRPGWNGWGAEAETIAPDPQPSKTDGGQSPSLNDAGAKSGAPRTVDQGGLGPEYICGEFKQQDASASQDRNKPVSESGAAATRKPLRPHCLNPGLCAGSGREHCHACKKAMAGAEVVA